MESAEATLAERLGTTMRKTAQIDARTALLGPRVVRVSFMTLQGYLGHEVPLRRLPSPL